MNEGNEAPRFHDKNVVVIGASRGLGRAIVAAAHAEGARVLAVARSAEALKQLASAFPGTRILALDATLEGAPSQVFETLAPDILVVCAGAIPHMAPLVVQTWEQFSRNWNSDVKMSLLFSQAALTTPLPESATIILISSGAAVNGSPLSGGYAGAKHMQMFLAHYAQKEADRLHLGLRFLALVPGGMIPTTDLGKVAIEAYASSLGISTDDFLKNREVKPTAEDVANAVVECASDPRESRKGVPGFWSRDHACVVNSLPLTSIGEIQSNGISVWRPCEAICSMSRAHQQPRKKNMPLWQNIRKG